MNPIKSSTTESSWLMSSSASTRKSPPLDFRRKRNRSEMYCFSCGTAFAHDAMKASRYTNSIRPIIKSR